MMMCWKTKISQKIKQNNKKKQKKDGKSERNYIKYRFCARRFNI